MDIVWTILKVLAGIVAFANILFTIIIFKRMKRRDAALPNMSVEDLRALAAKQPFIHCNRVIQELKSRNEDISFALPLLLKLAVHRNMAARIVGWSGLKQYFSDQLPDLDFTKGRPNACERNWIESKLNEIN